MGAVTPVGLNLAQSWENVVNGRSGIETITSFDPTSYDTKIAGEVKGFNVDDFVPKKEQKKMDRFIHFTLAAAKMALDDAELNIPEDRRERFGTIIGVGLGGLPIIEKQHQVLMERGPSRMTPFFIPAIIANMAAGHVSMTHGLKGPGNFWWHDFGLCIRRSRDWRGRRSTFAKGHVDVMVTGGAEAAVSPMAIGGC